MTDEVEETAGQQNIPAQDPMVGGGSAPTALPREVFQQVAGGSPVAKTGSPVATILAGLGNALSELESAVESHKDSLGIALSQVEGELASSELGQSLASASTRFATSSDLGQSLASVFSRILDVANDVRTVTSKLEL